MKSKRNHRVLFILDGDNNHASSRIRLLQYVPIFLQQDCFDFEIHTRVKSFEISKIGKLKFFLFKRVNRVILFIKILFGQYRLYFVQRTLLSKFEISTIINWKKAKLIYDVDDGIFLYDNITNLKFINTVMYANAVIVSSPTLENYIKNYNTNINIIFSSVDSLLYNSVLKEKKDNIFIIGWSGSDSTIKYVMNIIDEIVAILDKYPEIQFHYISSFDRLGHFHKNIFFHLWSESSEPQIISDFDIGIMPLNDDEWSYYKGGYKLFMYLMSNIPVIASPVGINCQIVENERYGLLPKNNNEWFLALEKLSSNSEIYERIKNNIALMDKKKFDLQKNATKLIEQIKTEL